MGALHHSKPQPSRLSYKEAHHGHCHHHQPPLNIH